jgi:hypothetical protein
MHANPNTAPAAPATPPQRHLAVGEQTTITRAINFTMRALSIVEADAPLFWDDLDDISRALYPARDLAREAGAVVAAQSIADALADLGDDFHVHPQSRAEIAGNLAEALKLLRGTN